MARAEFKFYITVIKTGYTVDRWENIGTDLEERKPIWWKGKGRLGLPLKASNMAAAEREINCLFGLSVNTVVLMVAE